MHVDTVSEAASTPDVDQPYRELGLKDDEYQRIREILGRRPTDAELAMYSVMWSEHCSYKSSKVHLRYFGETTTDEMRSVMLAGIGENAGVVDVGDGWAVTFKVESHNHPSYVEPYQGAATGVGGIVRDIMAMGARPIAVMDQLRFGPADAPDTRRVLDGVVRGVGGYGNSLGLPNVGGETVFDASYAGNPLVNALCAGVLRTEDLHLAFASGVGNKIILFGARTGLDGIGGVSVLASETFDEGEKPKKLPAVQVGDPFTEKVLIECCLDLYREKLVVGIQDLGGAGLSCATSELAAAGSGGMHIDLEKVPTRATGMTPAEVLSSESQERMCAVVTPENVDEFMAVCAKWDVLATVIGEVTDGPHLQITWNGETVVDAPARTIAHDGPVYERPVERPAFMDELIANTTAGLRRPASDDELRATALKMLASPALCSRKFITEQYDRYVRGNTVLAENADGGVLRIDESTQRGIALSTDASGRYTYLDPYEGGRLALAEAYRNVAVTGATPKAVTDCLNFGSPEDPGVMWQFQQAVHGIADGCVELGIPVTGGNVSFYNQTGSTAILPTPVIGVLGVIDDVRRRIPTGLGTEPGETLYLLGETHDEFDGSIWAQVEHEHLGGVPPKVDLQREKLLADVLTAASRDGLVSAAHDLSEGGLWQAVAEAALAGETGCRLILPEGADAFVQLFSESTGRVLVAVPRTEETRFAAMCSARGLPAERIGVVDQGSDAVEVQGRFSVPLAELRAAHEGTLPALFA
ncbi:Phosphoribosylformylglycinamidine synthase subunit PurL OS=Tsukamurella paurometabola (strain ATCC 8368 / DSM / CCUG 35730 / CIP 100753 / JCM 10117 / KCTC 9821 / NBRC 16120 / NCIMB 702349 / NCTC 13040) OX=521096 GN=purL PE=3 SV=1 [Tsukamurella paurometabola]|uniref:Phosphoribosylformylglycinamidine synthase subunit PurL n=1 Tax=Tsukamurella paurometabola (strain ATCC 8368 / DSM 20162 / CCUG 35730 / CIP 100753 / JCM 10117 / KCTC 9821 / NBRC 16120 / NCIMB 702349 / NCTC 13040) TaxID=521096 RepID=D5UXT3_TSUPD|nr:phosphoribosylformylglycinamidine synthase subunit PurL [Tsukamurella paurometabola]ADG80170.1 phosphoribosylformylglycinamidine synthase II [Tsukamurella paurometabola DSM 20162]SUP38693.1 Phosphoribosylformylglycinamidine synthase 2 [Tsukamurella paurometabola]